MRARTAAVKQAYRSLSKEEKTKLSTDAKIKANTLGFIQDDFKRQKQRKIILEEITQLLDQLESQCGDDTILYSAPRKDPGINQICTSRAIFPLLKLKEMNFSKMFVIYCSETIDRLDCLDMDTLRTIARRLMHSLMSKSKKLNHYFIILL
jgi:hypothetical protein